MTKQRLTTVLIAILCSLMARGAVANNLPAKTNGNLQFLGYYYADGRYDDFKDQVAPYTNLYLALATGYSIQNQSWHPQFQASLQYAWNHGMWIYLHLHCPLLGNPSTDPYVVACGDIIADAAPYWSRVRYIEVDHEAGLTQAQVENDVNTVKAAIAAYTGPGAPLDLNKQYGILQSRCEADNGFGYPAGACVYTGKNATNIGFVAIEAYANAGESVASMETYLDRAKNNVAGGKEIVLVTMSYDQGGTWNDVRVLNSYQKSAYMKAYNDGRVSGITMFNYARKAADRHEGGTRMHPELKIAHYQMAERILGRTFPVNNAAPYHQYLSEGSQSGFWKTAISVANPGCCNANVWLRLRRNDGFIGEQYTLVPPGSRTTFYPDDIAGFSAAEFGIEVISDANVTASRTMAWDGSSYGSHLETAVPSPSTTWYIAEGSTGMSLYYLLENPNPTAANVSVWFYRPSPAPPIPATYTVNANSRLTIDVGATIGGSDVGAAISSSQPIVAERSMYYTPGATAWEAGTNAVGVTAQANTWYFAEGVTGSFAMYLSLLNPNGAASIVRATYYNGAGAVILTKDYTVPAQSRSTIYVNGEPGLSSTQARVRLDTINGVPFVADRTLWWGAPWWEGHSSAGSASTSTHWAIAAGESTVTYGSYTFLLIANTSPTPGNVTVRFLLGDDDRGANPGTIVWRTYPIGANATLAINATADILYNGALGFGIAAGYEKLFGIDVTSDGPQLVVEESVYSNKNPYDGKNPPAAGANAFFKRY